MLGSIEPTELSPHVPKVTTVNRDFRHLHQACVRPYNGLVLANPQRPSRLSEKVRLGQWPRVLAIATWLVSGLVPMVGIAGARVPWWPAAIFITAYLLYGIALLTLLYLPERWMCIFGGRFIPMLLLFEESVSGISVMYVSGHYLGGTGATAAMVVIVAAQLPYVLRAPWAWLYVMVQTAVVSLLFWEAQLQEVFSLALTIGGFQAFAMASSMLARSEETARERLAIANAELQAAQTLLAETSRAEERLRISRDLHDTLGHHLTALSLQLDVASRVSEGRGADHIRQAYAIARLLLRMFGTSSVRCERRVLRISPRLSAASPMPCQVSRST